MDNLLSKKELLKLTGISYGQLYRWKREKLIPEEWFEKKSSFTGQETFFPKEKILKRIEIIQKLKDTHSLEELAHFLSPELTDRLFQFEDIKKVIELDDCVLEMFAIGRGKQTFTYVDVVFMYAVSILRSEGNISEKALSEIIKSICSYSEMVKGTNCYLKVFKLEIISNTVYMEKTYTMVYQTQTQLLLDPHFKELRTFYLDELSNELKLKYDRGIV
jgi:DNA-binding transcriptional MerR regulator